jgi:NAD(P)-dependent dehydrogenase (short-subunit alcohol dehydrogenase family)
MTITLITGGNKGLGYETARRLIAEGHQVYVGARDRERGQRAADQLGAHFIQIDVSDDSSVAAAADCAPLYRATAASDGVFDNSVSRHIPPLHT